MELEGKIYAILPIATGTSPKGTWKKQELIIETQGAYPKKVVVSAWGQKADMLTSFNVGDSVNASIELESREYNGRWFTEVRVWKMEKLNTQEETVPAQEETINEPFGTTFSSEDDYVF